MAVDLFKLLKPPAQLNPKFHQIATHRAHAAGRVVANHNYETFVDVDGNFIEQFQTTGFDSRTWELYLHSYFTESGFAIDRTHDRPDFILKKDAVEVCIEAVTTAPTHGAAEIDYSVLSDEEELLYKKEHAYPLKFGSALFSKLKKEYWQLPHVASKPLVFAIAPFHAEDAWYFTDVALSDYLYRKRQTFYHEKDGTLVIDTHSIDSFEQDKKVVREGFFELPGTENISAVLFNNAGTWPMFDRLGMQVSVPPTACP